MKLKPNTILGWIVVIGILPLNLIFDILFSFTLCKTVAAENLDLVVGNPDIASCPGLFTIIPFVLLNAAILLMAIVALITKEKSIFVYLVAVISLCLCFWWITKTSLI